MKDILTFVEQKVRRICSLEAQNLELDHDLTNSQIENKELKIQVENLDQFVKEFESEHVKITNENNELSRELLNSLTTIHNLEVKIEQQNERISKNIIAINDLTAINKNLESKLSELVKENDRLCEK